MEGIPTAFYLAPLEHVIQNPYVLFRLVKPTPPTPMQKKGGVESSAGLVNVIPQRRIYRMETVSEIEIFKRELLKRPLVLQCVSHSGLGYGRGTMGCSLSSVDKNWVLLINQTHPKVLGRLQMGADAALHAMKKGHPFILRYRFGDLLQRLHQDMFANEILLSPNLQYTEWCYAELVIRFPGKVGHSKMTVASSLVAPKCRELNFDFADIELHEIQQVINSHNMLLRGPVPTITEDEIHELLPGWTINEITPLDAIGEERPETYSYAQAGRLYESFRKKKNQRAGNNGNNDKPAPTRPNAGMHMRQLQAEPLEDTVAIDEVETSFVDDGGFARRNMSKTNAEPRVKPPRKSRANDDYRNDVDSPMTHVYPNVKMLNSEERGHYSEDRGHYSEERGQYSEERGQYSNRNQYNEASRDKSSEYFDRRQGSHSESGYSSNSAGANTAKGQYPEDESYGFKSTGQNGYTPNGNYENQNRRDRNRGKSRDQHYENDVSSPRGHFDHLDQKYGSTIAQRGHENIGFHVDDHRQDDILKKHQQHVAKMLDKHNRYDYEPNGEVVSDRGHYGNGGYSRGGNYQYQLDDATPNGSYYDQRSHRDYNPDDGQPPSYRDVTSELQLHQQQEAMSESFI